MRRPADLEAWLRGGPPLEELRTVFPRETATVERQIEELLASHGRDQLASFTASLARPAGGRQARTRRGRDEALTAEVHRQIAAGLIRRLSVSVATGVTSGRLRFNLINGWVIQRLLFAGGLERKPVSMFWFRVLWPLVWQRRFLMPLVGPEGVYCFYSRRFVEELSALIGERECLEIAAGDGTLTRFLEARVYASPRPMTTAGAVG